MTPSERRLIAELAAAPAQLDLPPLQSEALGALGADAEYRHGRKINAITSDDYERLISAWLEEVRPGAFFNRDGGDIYKKSHLLFTEHSREKIYQGNSIDDWEVALSRLGFRAGVFVHNYLEMWILLLPAKRTAQPVTARPLAKDKPLDESFKDLIGADSLSGAEMDSLLEVLANHEATPAD